MLQGRVVEDASQVVATRLVEDPSNQLSEMSCVMWFGKMWCVLLCGLV